MRMRMIFVAAIFAMFGLPAHAADGEGLKIGITLHPYYSFVANIVGDRAEVIPLIGAESNPHGYSPQPDDIRRATEMDVMVVNGIGHDEWAFEIIEAARKRRHLAIAAQSDRVDDCIFAAAIQPYRIIQARRSEQWIAIAGWPMTGDTQLGVLGLARMSLDVATGSHGLHETDDVAQAFFAKHRLPWNHYCGTAITNRLFYLFRRSAPLPVGIAQIRKHAGLSASIGTVAG